MATHVHVRIDQFEMLADVDNFMMDTAGGFFDNYVQRMIDRCLNPPANAQRSNANCDCPHE